MRSSWLDGVTRPLACLALAVPLALGAQTRGGRAGSFGTLPNGRPAPSGMAGFGTLRQELPSTDQRMNPGVHQSWRRDVVGALPFILGTEYVPTAPAPAPVAVPYPVPYPVPVAAPAASPNEPPEPPYNPANSRMVIIGSGSDGGGGVMKIFRHPDGTVQLSWLGAMRPIADAELFLADSDQQLIQTRAVDLLHRDVTFTPREQLRKAAFAGLKIVFADGATQLWLVPLT